MHLQTRLGLHVRETDVIGRPWVFFEIGRPATEQNIERCAMRTMNK